MKLESRIMAVLVAMGLTMSPTVHAQGNSPQGLAQRVANLEAALAAVLAQARVPSGAVLFFARETCPDGWTEYEAAQGRYLVGLPPDGAPGAQVGIALVDQEDRAVGRHSHGTNDPGHSHGFIDHFSSLTGINAPTFGYLEVSAQSVKQSTGFNVPSTTDPSSTGVTVNPSGNVAGTNAPYIQLRVCQKD